MSCVSRYVLGNWSQMCGQICALLGLFTFFSQSPKNCANWSFTLAAVIAGVRALLFDRGVGTISRNTLSAVEFGLVCVP